MKISLFRTTVKYVITPCTPNHYKNKFIKTKMPSLSIKEREAKLILMIRFSEKKSTLSSYVDIEYNSAESLTNKYKLFGTKSKQTINSLAPSKKYIMIEEFKDELRDLKNILNEIKKTGTIETT